MNLEKSENPVRETIETLAGKYLDSYLYHGVQLENLVKYGSIRAVMYWAYFINRNKMPPWEDLTEDEQGEFFDMAQGAEKPGEITKAAKGIYYLTWAAQQRAEN